MKCRKLKSDLWLLGQKRRQPESMVEMDKLLGASLLILWLQPDCEFWAGGLNIVENFHEAPQGWEMGSLGSCVLVCIVFWLVMFFCGDLENKI